MTGSYPKYLFKKTADGIVDKLVATEDAHIALEEKEPGVWAEGPEHFDEAGKAVHVEDTVEEDVIIPGVTEGTSAYPKWLYHVDGQRQQVVETKAAHDAMVDKDDWLESPDLSANLRSNSVAEKEEAGQALWETPVRDVLEMLKGATLATLEKTHALEEKNPGGPRRTLQRELADMIVDAQAAESAKVDG